MPTEMKRDLSYGTVVTDESSSYCCCGIKYRDWILTSGLILCPYISSDDINFNLTSGKFTNVFRRDDDKSFNSSSIINCLSRRIANKRFKILSPNDKISHFNDRETFIALSTVNPKHLQSLNADSAYSIGVFRSDLICDYISSNFSDWELCTSQEKYKETSSEVIESLLSVFLLLKVGDKEISDDLKIPLTYFMKLCSNNQNIFRGSDIIVESTPFAISQFYNSWSKGIVSNNIGSKDCLFYTDARLVIGCVGAPVYGCKYGNKGDLIGMILNPMLWSQGEWAGFSVAVNLHVVLHEALNYEIPFYKNPEDFTEDLTKGAFIDNLDRSVVLVRCGYNWGSGVVVNAKLGVILTCAHVVNYGKEEVVSIECKHYKTKAKVIYFNKPGEVFDIAILSTEPLLKLQEIPFSYDAPVKGETVFCVGFPLIDTDLPTLSKGIISYVEPDIVIQTTCCVQSGVSGGAIVRSDGSLLGIPVSNMSCATTHAHFPHCNLCIPTGAFADILTHYFTTKDANCLKKLESDAMLVLQKWYFQIKSKL